MRNSILDMWNEGLRGAKNSLSAMNGLSAIAAEAQDAQDEEREAEQRQASNEKVKQEVKEFVKTQYPAIMEEEGLDPNSLFVYPGGNAALEREKLRKNIHKDEVDNTPSPTANLPGDRNFSISEKDGKLHLEIVGVERSMLDYHTGHNPSYEDRVHNWDDENYRHDELRRKNFRECRYEEAMGELASMLMKQAYGNSIGTYGKNPLIDGEDEEVDHYKQKLRRIAERLDSELATNAASNQLDNIIKDEREELERRAQLKQEEERKKHYREEQTDKFNRIREGNEERLAQLRKFEELDGVEVEQKGDEYLVSVKSSYGGWPRSITMSIAGNAHLDEDYNIQGRENNFNLKLLGWRNKAPAETIPALNKVFAPEQPISERLANCFRRQADAEEPEYRANDQNAMGVARYVAGAIAALQPENESQIRDIKNHIEKSVKGNAKASPSQAKQPA